jgi:copper oxidase (laccase) domain-containing protein
MRMVRTLYPDWPAPPAVRAAFTLRLGGVSVGAIASLNLGVTWAMRRSRWRRIAGVS